MSAFLLGIGFRADMGTCVRKLVLLKLIDACDEDGTRIFPAISTIARAAQCSPRQVQREMKAFVDIGLIRLVREGGKGPRSTNEYALDLIVLDRMGKLGWAAMSGESSDIGKGDTVSPLEPDDKGDICAPVRVTQETAKGDKLSHPTPPDPSLEPSIEREARERDTENPKEVERAFDRAWRDWPPASAGSRPEALRAWIALQPDERMASRSSIGRWIAADRAAGRKYLPKFSKYLAEKRWENLPPLPVEPEKATSAPAFGPVWAGIRIRDFVTGQKAFPALKGWELQAIEDGTLKRETAERSARQNSGWPAVNVMHAKAANGQCIYGHGPEEERLGKLCEFVRIDTDCWKAWKAEHELRGWPWLPDPGTMRGAYFPAGGPGALNAFEAAIRGTQDDAGGREAAE